MQLEDLSFWPYVVSLELDRPSYYISYHVYLEWGSDNPFTWEVNVANSWRTTQGRPENWNGILYNIDIVG
jgi:hypothetical protein